MIRRLVVADSLMLTRAERKSPVLAALGSGFSVCIPDLLYTCEVERLGDDLVESGLEILSLDGVGVEQAVEFRRRVVTLSLSQVFALALAKQVDAALLTGENRLGRLAAEEGVSCHDVWWLEGRIGQGRDAWKKYWGNALMAYGE